MGPVRNWGPLVNTFSIHSQRIEIFELSRLQWIFHCANANLFEFCKILAIGITSLLGKLLYTVVNRKLWIYYAHVSAFSCNIRSYEMPTSLKKRIWQPKHWAEKFYIHMKSSKDFKFDISFLHLGKIACRMLQVTICIRFTALNEFILASLRIKRVSISIFL
jgi:hypothetical protein